MAITKISEIRVSPAAIIAAIAPASAQVEAALTRMVEAVKSGNLDGLIPFDRQGEAVQLD